jgi:uncharacterized protein (TIRG00374 family)
MDKEETTVKPGGSDTPKEPSPKKKINAKYLISMLIVLVMTGLSLFFSLYGHAGEVQAAFADSNIWWLLCILALVAVSYMIDGLVVQIFCRLYTRHYKWHQGFANAMIGSFYSGVTPGASGGQVMQVYTLKKQGIEVSNGASIMVMWFIIYQFALVVFDIFAVLIEWDTIMSIKTFTVPGINIGDWHGEITMVPLIIIGFVLNVSIMGMLLLMSYSHHFHNFIMHYVINFLAKIHLIKDPDKTRENLRVQVENFRIELRRLQANVPVTLLIFFLFTVNLIIRYSIPYFAGLALNSFQGEDFNFERLFDACFRSAFHQMVTGLFPLPGSAGVSELFFAIVFNGYYFSTPILTDQGLFTRPAEANLAAAQVLWRTVTFHLVILAGGITAAFYKSRPQQDYQYANRQTYVNLQLETYEERKKTSDTLYETKQLSRKDIQRRLSSWSDPLITSGPFQEEPTPLTDRDRAALKAAKLRRKKKGNSRGWDN